MCAEKFKYCIIFVDNNNQQSDYFQRWIGILIKLYAFNKYTALCRYM